MFEVCKIGSALVVCVCVHCVCGAAITLSLCFVIGVNDDRVKEAAIKQTSTTVKHDYYSHRLFVCRWPTSHITVSLW